MERAMKRGGNRIGYWTLGLVLSGAWMGMNGADLELDAAAEELARAGREVSRGGVVAVGSGTVTGSPGPVAAVAGSSAAGPAVVESFQGTYVGKVGDGSTEVIGRFSGAKVEWIEPGKRAWNPKTTNVYAYQFGAGKLTMTRPGTTPLVYGVSGDRKELVWESGELKVPAKQFKLTSP